MAYVQDEEQQKAGAGGQVLAGSGGAKSGAGQQVGTGFTNLQKYLSANAGQGGGIANDITEQGQKAVDAEKAISDGRVNSWADQGVQSAEAAAQEAANTFNTASANLKSDPNTNVAGVIRTTYGGPQSAQDVQGYNDLENAYQNVKNTVTGFQGDRMTQQAGLQQKYGYGSGFAALDGFLGRQDGRDTINNWANNVNTGSAQSGIDRVNNAIATGKQNVATAQSGFAQANADAKRARSAQEQNPAPSVTGTGIADQIIDKQEQGDSAYAGMTNKQVKSGNNKPTRGSMF